MSGQARRRGRASAFVHGLKEAQRANERLIAAVQPGGALGEAVRQGLVQAHRFAIAITHVDTGALRASHRMAFSEEKRAAIGRMFIDPTAVSRHGQMPAEYGPHEHARSGEHAFYARVLFEKGMVIARSMVGILRRGVK